MLKSQSISNLSEQRKSKASGFLNSLKSRKSSSKDLKSYLRTNNNVSNTEHNNTNSNKNRITASMSSISLLLKLHDHQDGHSPSKNKNDYSSTVARERGARVLDKENYLPPNHTLKNKKSSSSVGSFHEEIQPHVSPFKALKTRSSAPNLKSGTSLSTSPNISVPCTNVASITPPPEKESFLKKDSTFLSLSSIANNVPKSPSLINILSDEETIADSNSPYTPPTFHHFETPESPDALIDDSAISLQAFDYFSSDDLDFEDTVVEQSEDEDENDQIVSKAPFENKKNKNYRRLHRTTNILNISEFIKSIDHSNEEIIPMNNRCSLEFEQKECYKIKLNLLAAAEKEIDAKPLIDLHLIENVMFLSVKQREIQSQQYELASKLDSWYDQDYFDVLKNDPYQSDDDELYLNL